MVTKTERKEEGEGGGGERLGKEGGRAPGKGRQRIVETNLRVNAKDAVKGVGLAPHAPLLQLLRERVGGKIGEGRDLQAGPTQLQLRMWGGVRGCAHRGKAECRKNAPGRRARRHQRTCPCLWEGEWWGMRE